MEIVTLEEYMKDKRKGLDELSKEKLFEIGQKLVLSRIKRNQYKKDWYNTNREKIAEGRKKYYQNHCKERKAKSREYFYNHTEERRAYQREYEKQKYAAKKEQALSVEEQIEEAMRRG